jgi:hypothetical protein
MSRFSDYVTSAAFSLTLSKPMIDALSWEMLYDGADLGPAMLVPMPNLTSWDALERRGLLERFPKKPHVRVTDEGRAVYFLLQKAGLVPQVFPWKAWTPPEKKRA